MQEHTLPATFDGDHVVLRLVDNHRAFLRFLERRVGDRGLAEDILQEAFVRSLRHPAALPDEAVVPWFYRVLRNAVIDQHRRRASSEKALATYARELEASSEPPVELADEICACVGRLADTLKPEYAAILRAVDVHGASVKAFAEQTGVSASNAGVRIFRAREALRRRVTESCGRCAEHGCLNCTCGARQPGGAPEAL
jgi:RNA polymerase sigma-70 factor (ECF subfamily)